MVKVIFFDVDGTLVSHATKRVPESAAAAVEKLRKKGIKCVMCTGRHILEIDELPARELEFDAYITLVGQLLLDNERNVLAGFPFPPEQRRQLVELFREKRYPMQLVEKDGMYINFVNDRVRQVQSEISTSVPEVGDYSAGDIYQVVCYADPQEQAAMEDFLSPFYVSRWNSRAIDILPGGGGKILGIKEYLRVQGVDICDTMAFGDGENDAEMLAFVGTGIAMGNAVENSKKAADYVTDHIDSDGVEKALVHFGLI